MLFPEKRKATEGCFEKLRPITPMKKIDSAKKRFIGGAIQLIIN
jgi:hypothetical protein